MPGDIPWPDTLKTPVSIGAPLTTTSHYHAAYLKQSRVDFYRVYRRYYAQLACLHEYLGRWGVCRRTMGRPVLESQLEDKLSNPLVYQKERLSLRSILTESRLANRKLIILRSGPATPLPGRPTVLSGAVGSSQVLCSHAMIAEASVVDPHNAIIIMPWIVPGYLTEPLLDINRPGKSWAISIAQMVLSFPNHHKSQQYATVQNHKLP